MAGRMSAALRERLGEEASDGLVDFMEENGRQWRDDVLKIMTDRFGRMLAEECGKLRAELHAEIGRLRSEVFGEIGKLRAEVFAEVGKLRTDVFTEIGKLRVEMVNGRAELLKWCFLFWVGQVATIAALMAFMLRNVGR